MNAATKEMAGMTFKNISTELVRTYKYANGYKLVIKDPVWLNVKKDSDTTKLIGSPDSHRLLTASNISYYIAPGFIAISWVVRDGADAFVC